MNEFSLTVLLFWDFRRWLFRKFSGREYWGCCAMCWQPFGEREFEPGHNHECNRFVRWLIRLGVG